MVVGVAKLIQGSKSDVHIRETHLHFDLGLNSEIIEWEVLDFCRTFGDNPFRAEETEI